MKSWFDVPTTEIFILMLFVSAGVLFEGTFSLCISLTEHLRMTVYLVWASLTLSCFSLSRLKRNLYQNALDIKTVPEAGILRGPSKDKFSVVCNEVPVTKIVLSQKVVAQQKWCSILLLNTIDLIQTIEL